MNAQTIDFFSAIVFVAILGLFLYRKRKHLILQKLVGIGKIPLIFILMLRTRWGLDLMDRIASKYRELVKLFGYVSIGIGFTGMMTMLFFIVWALFTLMFRPESQAANIAFVLPFTNIPGLGYLSFWHFLISIFIIAAIHEFSHGVVARAHNIKVTSSGFGVLGIIIPALPLAFVEPDEKKIKKESDVVQYSIFSAGPVINILFAVLIAFLLNLVITPIEAKITEPTGFSYTVINDSYPAFVMGDSTIIGLNGEDVDDFTDFARAMQCVSSGETINIQTTNSTHSILTVASPDDAEKGFIGIRPTQNERRVIEGYEVFGNVFGWFKQLFTWLFNINLAVGLINLLPIFIVDGGRMFAIAMDRILPGKSARIINIIGLICLFVLILGLAKNYLHF